MTAANKAQHYANSVSPGCAPHRAFFEVMKRAEAQAKAEPKNANAHYLYAYAADVTASESRWRRPRAGYAARSALRWRRRSSSSPSADAYRHGAYHAEIIDKVGALVGGLTHGASARRGRALPQGGETAPDSPIAHRDGERYVLMHGKKMVEEGARLYAKAAQMEPRDAMEKLDVEAARAEID